MHKIIQIVKELLLCPLNHDWQLLTSDKEIQATGKIKHRCRKCGKSIERTL